MPNGRIANEEIPAGMMDDDNEFGGTACKEMFEETGLEINKSELEDLSHLFHPGTKGMYPSPGGCDEAIRLFTWRKSMSKLEIDALKGKCTGEIEEGEAIKLKIILYE